MIFKKDNEHLNWPKYVDGYHYLCNERICVHENANVAAFTTLRPGVCIGADTTISPHCTIGNNSTLKPKVILERCVTVQSEVLLGAGCLIDTMVVIPASTSINDNIHVLSTPTCIMGSRHPCYWAEPGTLAIGCEQHFIEAWLSMYQGIGKCNAYSAEQIAEYHAYIRFFAANPCRSLEPLEGKV